MCFSALLGGFFTTSNTWEAYVGDSGLVVNSCLTLGSPCTITYQAPLSMGFPRQEYWSGLSFPSLEDLLNPGLEARSPALNPQADSLPPDL